MTEETKTYMIPIHITGTGDLVTEETRIYLTTGTGDLVTEEKRVYLTDAET